MNLICIFECFGSGLQYVPSQVSLLNKCPNGYKSDISEKSLRPFSQNLDIQVANEIQPHLNFLTIKTKHLLESFLAHSST